MAAKKFVNPFRPGAGHMPPYLAGRESEKREFKKLLEQDVILENLVLTGLRGVGKTVLLETFKPIAFAEGWLWVGTDLSESTSINEENIAIRLLTDLSVVTSSVVISTDERTVPGIQSTSQVTEKTLDYEQLVKIYSTTPGLVSDKLKRVLETVWEHVQKLGKRGIIFAYDEAQNLSDHADKDQYPLSLLLDVFQSIQRKGIPFMLALTGLPTLFPKLVESRTFSERMFHVLFLSQLNEVNSAEAIRKPIQDGKSPINFNDQSVSTIFLITGGYPYFIQYVCKECFDVWVQNFNLGETPKSIPVEAITRKLDTDFFSGRWARATDRQRDLLRVISQLENCSTEFEVKEIVEQSKKYAKPFSPSHVSQLLSNLGDAGLVYKNRWGKYSLAVPLLDQFIIRQYSDDETHKPDPTSVD